MLDIYQRKIVEAIKDARRIKIVVGEDDGIVIELKNPQNRKVKHDVALAVQEAFRLSNEDAMP